MTPNLIAVDWGTSSFRATLMGAAGVVLGRTEAARGILTVADGAFAAVLAEATQPWCERHGNLPILMSGMIGSRQGWREVPYLACPAGRVELAAALMRFDAGAGLGPVAIVPGLMAQSAGVPDVMRGEETQLVGVAALTGRTSGLFVLPGSHSKWARLEEGRIVSFSTYMSGEVYAALKDHTILGRLMQVPPSGPVAAEAFRAGVLAGGAAGPTGDLLRRLFAVRTLGLFERRRADELADYLSGLLIGAEIAAAARPGEPVTLIASPALAERYAVAIGHLGFTAEVAPDDCAARGVYELAVAAGLIEGVGR